MSIKVSTQLHVTKKELWQALTEVDKMKQWFFNHIPQFKPEIGFTTSFPVVSDGSTFTHLWKVKEVVPEEKLVLEWCYEEYTGCAEVVFKLEKLSKQQTRLQVENIGLSTFPQNIPEFSEQCCIAGWEYFMKERLPDYLSKKT